MTKDGGPAFPRQHEASWNEMGEPDAAGNQGGHHHPAILSHPGMSLRDWFAGQALSGFRPGKGFEPEKLGDWAYQVADAMLSEREKGND